MKQILSCILSAAALSAVSVGIADAADMPLKAPPMAAPSCVWCGWYIGGNVGGKWADLSDSTFVSPATGPGGASGPGTLAFGTSSAGTFIGGGQLGYNWQNGPMVFGVEGSIDGQHWRKSFVAGPAPGFPFVAGDSFSATSNWEASFRGRLGYAWDRTLLYATGGIAWTRVSDNTNFIATGGFPASSASDHATLAGGTLGGGLEYAVTNNVSLGVEGLYTWYGNHTFNGGTVATVGFPPGGPFTSAPASQTVNLNTAEVMATLNIKLGSLFGGH